MRPATRLKHEKEPENLKQIRVIWLRGRLGEKETGRTWMWIYKGKKGEERSETIG